MCADSPLLRGPRPNHCQMAARVFASGDVYEAGKRLRGIRLREGPNESVLCCLRLREKENEDEDGM